jgi:hypothetical protein
LRNPKVEGAKVKKKRQRTKAKWNDYMNGNGTHFIIFPFQVFEIFIYFFDLGSGPTLATIVFMDWMIKRAPHVESEPKTLSNHNQKGTTTQWHTLWWINRTVHKYSKLLSASFRFLVQSPNYLAHPPNFQRVC